VRPSVFQYLDYRAFLKDYFAFTKAQSPTFSFRRFSKDAGFASPNFLKLVYDGKRNLTTESVYKVTKAFKLKRSESDFFSNLVFFNQAESSDEKNSFYQKMQRSKTYREIRGLERDQYEYYSQWYHVAIRELVETNDFHEDYEWIAGRVRPKISPKQAEEAITLLLKLRLLSRDSEGKLIQSDANISTGAEVRSLAVLNFHRVMLEAAEKSLDQISPQERDITSATFAVSANQMDELKRRVAHFRKTTLTWLSSSSDLKSAVYQMGIQIFPLTELKGEGADK
jgi:uncharacterized protein (TIGR02147 family)